MTVIAVLLCLAAAGVIVSWRMLARRSRRRFLEAYRLPDAIVKRFTAIRAELNEGQRRLVQQGLTQYFRICQESRGKFVSMPSQVVDDLWHEFILFTRNYERFCDKAFGRYLHHTPVEAMSGATQATEGIRRTWFHACRLEGINPKQPERLPLLFALDAQLGISNGFFYALHCDSTATSGGTAFCASSFGCGSDAGAGNAASCGGDAGGHGGGHGGCGGDGGCGGGGCGGGGD